MRLAPIRYCGQLRYATRDGFTVNRGLLAGAPAQVLKLVQRYKSDKKASGTDCCKEPDQTANKRVDCWPTNRELQPPPNYDPYHIKVPKVAVPSLPTSDAKAERARVVDFPKSWESNFDLGSMNLGSMFHIAPVVHPDNKQAAERSLPQFVQEVLPPLGYHGRVQYKYAFHEPWKPLDRLTLLAKAQPCSGERGAAAAAAAADMEASAPLEDKPKQGTSTADLPSTTSPIHRL